MAWVVVLGVFGKKTAAVRLRLQVLKVVIDLVLEGIDEQAEGFIFRDPATARSGAGGKFLAVCFGKFLEISCLGFSEADSKGYGWCLFEYVFYGCVQGFGDWRGCGLLPWEG